MPVFPFAIGHMALLWIQLTRHICMVLSYESLNKERFVFKRYSCSLLWMVHCYRHGHYDITMIWTVVLIDWHVDGLVQQRHNSIGVVFLALTHRCILLLASFVDFGILWELTHQDIQPFVSMKVIMNSGNSCYPCPPEYYSKRHAFSMIPQCWELNNRGLRPVAEVSLENYYLKLIKEWQWQLHAHKYLQGNNVIPNEHCPRLNICLWND